jgi:hypothetical protein
MTLLGRAKSARQVPGHERTARSTLSWPGRPTRPSGGRPARRRIIRYGEAFAWWRVFSLELPLGAALTCADQDQYTQEVGARETRPDRVCAGE